MLEKCFLTVLELNWNQRLGHKKTKIKICHHMFTSSTQLQNRTENVFKMSKDDVCTCKACKNTVFHCQICKFVGFLLPSSPWLLKLPNLTVRFTDELVALKTTWHQSASQAWLPNEFTKKHAQMVTHPVINPVRHGLTWVNKRELVSPLVQAETEVSRPGGET